MAISKGIKILDLRDVTLAKVDYKGSFQGIGKVYAKLMNWARANAYTDAKKHKTITIYHDDPNVVGMNNVRQSACIITDTPFEPNGDIKKLEFKPGKCVVGRFEISYFQFQKAWIEMFEWIENHNLKASKSPAFEVYQNNSNTHPQKKCIIDICIPIE